MQAGFPFILFIKWKPVHAKFLYKQLQSDQFTLGTISFTLLYHCRFIQVFWQVACHHLQVAFTWTWNAFNPIIECHELLC